MNMLANNSLVPQADAVNVGVHLVQLKNINSTFSSVLTEFRLKAIKVTRRLYYEAGFGVNELI